EARALSDTDDTTEAIRALSAMGVDIAVTDGSNGSLVHINGTTTTTAPFPVQACDTTGAGDSYAAGLLFGLTNGRSVSESGNIASRYSSRVVAQLGPRFSGDIRTELKKEGVL
ncbi:MAG: adenosine kinase, partial [Deltaproteobacteria bacterium]|nr:adenosine kinase [Deltaproteobacteria bacterium]